MSASVRAGAPPAPRTALIALALVSAAALGFETSLTRFFAVADWSEYGYWVISLVMVGFAVSGVVLALFRDPLVKRADLLIAWLPTAMVAAAALGYHFTITNPFNPLELQNLNTWQDQIGNMFGFYVALFPFYFLTGTYITLLFSRYSGEIGRVYGYDLAGAGLGSLATLILMYFLPPFELIAAMLVPIAVSAWLMPGGLTSRIAAVVVLLLGEALLIFGVQGQYNQFKAIYAPLHTPNAQVLKTIASPRGYYQLLADFTERVDTDVSNNAAMMGYADPPTTFGLYKDGARIAAVAKPGKRDTGYAGGTLGAAPYLLVPNARVLLVGTSAGFRLNEALALGVARIDAVETDPILRAAITTEMDSGRPITIDGRARIVGAGPIGAARAAGPGAYDIVDISPDYLDTVDANGSSISADAIADYLRALSPRGIVSLPVSIRDLPVYALRTLATARKGLELAGIADPGKHLIVYRSAWNARILVSRQPWTPEAIAALRKFADDRSFDVSWFPGANLQAIKDGIYNDLPAVNFESGKVTSDSADDAIAEEAAAVIADQPTASARAFNLQPIRLDRPQYYSVLRLENLPLVLKRLEVLPQPEIGGLINIAVLGQALVIALIVLAIPIIAPKVRGAKGARVSAWRSAAYFAALGLAFLFIEIYLIDKAGFYLEDKTSGFALVLTAMLICSGLGSMLAERFTHRALLGRGAVLRWALIPIGAYLVLAYFLMEPLLLATLDWPLPVRIGMVMLLTAPVSVALGMPFPLGLDRLGQGAMLPWAWGLNGAFSVISTPVANLIARQYGYSWLLLAAAMLYTLVYFAFPRRAAAAEPEPTNQMPETNPEVLEC